MVGIVRSPRATFNQLASSPRPPWLDVLVVSTLTTFVVVAALVATNVGQTALVDQMERTAIAFGQPVDDAEYARFQALSGYGWAYAAGVAILTGPVLAIAVAALVMGLLKQVEPNRASFASVLSMVSHASVILALRQIVAAPINYAAETLASPTTLIQVVTGMDESSPVARFLGVVDIFVVWW